MVRSALLALHWTCSAFIEDASKFGQTYLSKFGWDPSRGLGVSGDGRTSHVKVVQKLNLMGIGAGAQQGPELLVVGDDTIVDNREFPSRVRSAQEIPR